MSTLTFLLCSTPVFSKQTLNMPLVRQIQVCLSKLLDKQREQKGNKDWNTKMQALINVCLNLVATQKSIKPSF